MLKLKMKSPNKVTVISVFILIALVLACLVSSGARRVEATQVIKYTQNPDYYPHYQKVKLEGSLICQIIPGTAGILDDGQQYFYTCGSDKTVILGPLDNEFEKSSPLWKVKVATLGKDWQQMGETRTVNVLRVWR
jgi:hypothetical protein